MVGLFLSTSNFVSGIKAKINFVPKTINVNSCFIRNAFMLTAPNYLPRDTAEILKVCQFSFLF